MIGPSVAARRRGWVPEMDCPSCGHHNLDGSRFCADCGHPLSGSVACPACGAAMMPGQRFCSGCGRPLATAPGLAPPPTPASGPDPRSLTPAHLADKIRAGKAALEGERKQVTVLFADVQGSMDLAASTDPEHWQRIMRRFFSLMCEGVHRFEGTVDKFTGDGMMALFGAPLAHEDHARRACYAALYLRDELAAYAGELRRTEGLSFSVRMGLNSGEVVVGTIGDDLSLEYTAIGHTVGLAQRMEALAEPGKAYLTGHTAALVSGFFELADLGRFDVKGVRQPIRTFELVGVGALRTPLEVARARGFSRFVGRADEMQILEAALEDVIAGKGSVVGVVAEPGTGKSRLCFEFAERCRRGEIEVVEGHALAHAKAVPFLPVLEVLRGFFGITEQDDDRTAREKVAGRLLLLDESFKDALGVIFEFLGISDPEHPAPRMDPQARQRQLFAALQRLSRRRTEQIPGLVLIEDLHWLDPGSEAFLENLLTVVPESRTLVLLNFRPEYRAQWMAEPYYHHLPLAPLGPEAAEELLTELLGTDPSLDGLAEVVREQTGGNPFFIEEVVQALADDGTLEGQKGAYRLVHTVDRVTIPPTVQAVLAARIDRLPARDKSVLETAAVIGRRFTEPVLRRVSELEQTELEAALRELVEAEFIYQESPYPEAEYAFKHPLTEEIAYRTQLGERRVRVHGAVAAALAELYPDRHDEYSALLAHHWERAGDALQAARWSARAAVWAGFNDPSEALRHWCRVRDLADGLPASQETAPLGLGARIQILNLAWRLGGAVPEDDARAMFRAGRELAAAVDDRASLALLTSVYANVRGLAGAQEEYVDGALEALRLVEEVGDDALYMVVCATPIYALFHAGRLREALAIAERGAGLCSANPMLGAGVTVGSPFAFCTWWAGFLRTVLGDTGAGRRGLDRAVQLAREHGDAETEGWTQLAYVSVARLVGDAEGGLGHATRAVEIAERIGDSFSRGWAHTYVGWAHLLREEWHEAIAALEYSLEVARASGTGLEGQPFRLAFLAEALAATGDVDRARDLAREAVRRATERGRRFVEAEANRALARVLMTTDGLDALGDIKPALDKSLALAREMGARGLEPLILLDHARLARLRGDEAAARYLLQEAQALFAAVGAPEQAARLTAGAAVPD
jgi:class 3 adenylate cyclase/tetratricopeptide (TPR) repeat protein